MRIFCLPKKSLTKRCPKNKKSVHKKKNSKKNGKNINLKKKKQSYRLRDEKVFVFFQKKRVSKLSVFENGHFWLCPHMRLSSRTPPRGNISKVENKQCAHFRCQNPTKCGVRFLGISRQLLPPPLFTGWL